MIKNIKQHSFNNIFRKNELNVDKVNRYDINTFSWDLYFRITLLNQKYVSHKQKVVNKIFFLQGKALMRKINSFKEKFRIIFFYFLFTGSIHCNKIVANYFENFLRYISYIAKLYFLSISINSIKSRLINYLPLA